MSHSRSKDRQALKADLYLDETIAMVFVGDVYSLVAQEGSFAEPAKGQIADQINESAVQDDRDALWPFVR